MTRQCKAMSKTGYECTEPAGHVGPHKARDVRQDVIEQWARDERTILHQETIAALLESNFSVVQGDDVILTFKQAHKAHRAHELLLQCLQEARP